MDLLSADASRLNTVNAMKNTTAHNLIYLFTLVFLMGVFFAQGQRKRNDDRPNIIFILTDDQRWDALGLAGNKIIHTPEMNRLAAEGVNFPNAFVTTPICAASRASFLTGLHERTHRYTFQVDKVRDEHMTLSYPRLMKENGYYTGFFGKLGVNAGDNEKLFDRFEVYDRSMKFNDARGYFYKTIGQDTLHLTPYTSERALEFIQSAPDDKPFCLSLSFSAPHAHDPAPDQYFWEPEVDHLYNDVVIPDPELGEDKYFLAQPAIVRQGINRTRWGWRFDTPEKYQHSVKGYFRMISGVDREIGRIREALKRKNIDKNTIIILMGDNGYFLGERQLAGKWLLYENSIRVPLIIFDPRARSGQQIGEMALNIDVPATMLDYAGIRIPETWQGRSLVPLVKGTSTTLDRDTLFFEHLWETEMIPPSEGVRTKDWKYFRYINDKSIEELYALNDDPQEINDLAGDRRYRNVVLNLRKKADALASKYRDPLSGLPVRLKVDLKGGTNQSEAVAAVYGWELPAEALAQKGYQILVASSRENIDRNIGDVWNSLQTRSEKTGNIKHGGRTLVRGHVYFWKVRIWDQDNRLTEYTSPHQFKTPGKN